MIGNGVKDTNHNPQTLESVEIASEIVTESPESCLQKYRKSLLTMTVTQAPIHDGIRITGDSWGDSVISAIENDSVLNTALTWSSLDIK